MHRTQISYINIILAVTISFSGGGELLKQHKRLNSDRYDRYDRNSQSDHSAVANTHAALL